MSQNHRRDAPAINPTKKSSLFGDDAVVAALIENLRLHVGYERVGILVLRKFDCHVAVHQVIMHQIDGTKGTRAQQLWVRILSDYLAGI
jgi:hypothetical protein